MNLQNKERLDSVTSLLLHTHCLTGCGRQVGTANDEPVLRGTWTNQRIEFFKGCLLLDIYYWPSIILLPVQPGRLMVHHRTQVGLRENIGEGLVGGEGVKCPQSSSLYIRKASVRHGPAGWQRRHSSVLAQPSNWSDCTGQTILFCGDFSEVRKDPCLNCDSHENEVSIRTDEEKQ